LSLRWVVGEVEHTVEESQLERMVRVEEEGADGSRQPEQLDRGLRADEAVSHMARVANTVGAAVEQRVRE
jgi:hypothetical protein